MSFQVRKIQETKKPSRWVPILIGALKFGRPALSLFSLWKKKHDEEVKERKRVNALKRIMIILITVFCCVFLIAGMVKALTSLGALDLQSIFTVAGADLPKDAHGHTNILILGHGDPGHDGESLTDTIIVASIDPESKSVSMVSLPRDLYIQETELMGTGRINGLYAGYRGYLQYNKDMDHDQASLESMNEFSKEVGKMFGIDIHRVVKVNFTAFKDAVDAVGGVDIEVPHRIADMEYPNETRGYDPFIIEAGLHHLDGETALKYARSRHTTSDFGRSARQQQLIVALAEKAKAKELHKDPSAITRFMKIFQENIETTMSIREMISLAALGDDIDRSRILSMQIGVAEAGGFLYTPSREDFNGASVLLPNSISGGSDWKQLQAFGALYFNLREAYLANASISVLNAGGKTGVASILASELTRYGFQVDVIENLEVDRATSSISTLNPEKQELADFFGEFLNIPVIPIPLEVPMENTREITIILGSDYSFEYFQNLLSLPQ